MANKTKAELINDIENLRTDKHRLQDLESDYRKEIKELQETVRCGDELIGKQASEIKLLRDQATCDAFEVRELRNEIKDLQDVVIALRNDCNNLTAAKHEKANKVKDLEQVLKSAVDMRDYWLEEKDSEIKELQAEVKNCNLIIERKRNDYNDLNDRRWGAVERSAEKAKQIKQLQADAVHDAKESDKKSIEISRLRVLLDGADQVISENAKDISKLD